MPHSAQGDGNESFKQTSMPEMHGCWSTTYCIVVAAVLFSCCTSWASSTTTKTSDQTDVQLQRAELVRLAGYGEERLSSVLVTGTILLRRSARLQPEPKLVKSHPLPGMRVAVACEVDGRRRKSNWAYGVTDEYGDFNIDLPSHLHAIPRIDEDCIVKVLLCKPKDTFCRVQSAKRIKLSSAANGIRVYSAGTTRVKLLVSVS